MYRKPVSLRILGLIVPAAFCAAAVYVAGCETPCCNAGELTDSEPIVIDGRTNVVLSNLRITAPDGNGITVRNSSNVRIENCRIGPCKGEAVSIYNSKGVVVTDCHFEDVRTGVYAVRSQRIEVLYNTCRNVKGPFPRGQMAQFNGVTGPGNRISFNAAENIFGESHPEDVINLYKSQGTADEPIEVVGNLIRGGGPSGSGGGIMSGDAGGAHVIVRDNVLVDPGQYGIAIAGGSHIQLLDNTIYARRQYFTNVGLYVWEQYGSECHSNSVRGNRVHWEKGDGSLNPAWLACDSVSGEEFWRENNWYAEIGPDVLPEDLMNVDLRAHARNLER